MRFSIRSTCLVVAYSILIMSCGGLLFSSRTKAGPWHVWTVVHPWFIPVYLATVLFVAVVVMSSERSALKISFTTGFSVLTCLFLILVFDAGWGWDVWEHMGYSRVVYENLSPSPFSIHFSRPSIGSQIYYSTRHVIEYSLSVIFARTFHVDVYWAHLLLIPLLWGIFIPVICYSVTKALRGEERAAILSTFLVNSSVALIAWGATSVPQSLGYIFHFLTLYLLLRFLSHNKSVLPALISASASFLAHFITGVMSFSLLLLAIFLKRYHVAKNRRIASFSLLMTFLVCVSLLPFTYKIQQYFYPVYYEFSLSKLLALSPYDAILSLLFTQYGEYTIGEFVATGGIIDVLGFAGLLSYTWLKPKRMDDRVSRFLLLAFLIIIVDFRIILWLMPGAPARIWPLASLIAVPVASVAIDDLISFAATRGGAWKSGLKMNLTKAKSGLFRLNVKNVGSMTIVVICLFGMVAASVYNVYDRKGNGLSAYELEAAKYIDETTPGKYVVISDTYSSFAGYSLVGFRNPRAYYPTIYAVRELFIQMCSDPSPELMLEAVREFNPEASFQYFIVSTHSSHRYVPLSDVVEKASIYFEKYGVFGDVENILIYVFRYRTPPKPYSSDVSPFFWDIPPMYIIQNDLMRVIVPQNMSLEVRDFEGGLYEGVQFSETLVDGSPIGNVSKVEYFNPSDETWNNWHARKEIDINFAMKQQFRFKLSFSKVALIAIVERGKPFVQLRWESLDGVFHNVTCHLKTERYERFLMSSLTDADGSSVHSLKYGPYYTVSLTEDVTLHYAYNYETYGNIVQPYGFKDYSGFTTTTGSFWYDLYVDNEADVGQWLYLEAYLPDDISMGVFPRFLYSTDDGNTWTQVISETYRGPLKTVNGTEVNWVVTKARQGASKPIKWVDFPGGIGEEYSLPENFLDSGGCWNRIIFGMYLLGDTNQNTEIASGSNEGDQVLLRIGAGRWGRPLDATYIFEDSEDTSYGLSNMDDVFLTFYAKGRKVGGVTFTKRLQSLSITATEQDEFDHVTFDVACDATFSLLATDFDESFAYESLARLSYVISESDNEISLTANVTSANDWNKSAIVTICIPSDYNHLGGEILSEREQSIVLRVSVSDNRTETITIWPR